MSTLLPDLTIDNFAKILTDDNLAHQIETFVGAARFEGLWNLFQRPAPATGGRTVVLIPGILGTTLASGDDRVWIDPAEIAFQRGLERIRMVPGDAPDGDRDVASDGSPALHPVEPLPEIYSALASFLAMAGFNVVPLPFDWRRPIDAAADVLIAKLDALSGPVSVVAHSMGSLVARRSVQKRHDLADRIEHAVFLAPPFLGSFDPHQAVSGRYIPSALVNLLVGPGEVERVFKTLPGLADHIADADAFSLSALYDDPRGLLSRFDPKLPPRALRFSKDFRRPVGAARVADDKLMERAAIVFTTSLPTVTGVSMRGGAASFLTRIHGDGVVPTRSMWDDRAKGGHYRSTWHHAIVPVEPAVIYGTAHLLATRGREAGLLRPYRSMPEAGFGSILPFRAPLPSSRGPKTDEQRAATEFERVAAGRWTLDDLAPPAAAAEAPSTGLDLEALDARVSRGTRLGGLGRTDDRGGPAKRPSRRGRVAAELLEALNLGAARTGTAWRFKRRPRVRLAAGLTVVPDLAGWLAPEARGENGVDAIAPLPSWCCEVLSARTARDVLLHKLPAYAKAGVASVWLVDVAHRAVQVFASERGRPVLVDAAAGDGAVTPFAFELSLVSLWGR